VLFPALPTRRGHTSTLGSTQRRYAPDQFVLFNPIGVKVQTMAREFQLVASELRQQVTQRTAAFAADLIQNLSA
jgi:hypothetical protein